MRLGPFLVLLWLLVLLASSAPPVVHLLRHRTRGLARAFLAPLGGAMTVLLVILYVGLAESTWTWSKPTPWLLLLAGLAGFPLIALGWRAALRPRLVPGQCPRCGYATQGLAICPECGPGT